MSEHLQHTIADLQKQVEVQQSELNETKRVVNRLCKQADLPPFYAETDTQAAIGIGGIRSDQFYGQPLAPCVRTYMEMRRAANLGPPTVNEIFDALKKGNFKFESKNEENARRVVRDSLAKNTLVFHKLPNGCFGLTSWYPAIRDEPDEDESEKPAKAAKPPAKRQEKAVKRPADGAPINHAAVQSA